MANAGSKSGADITGHFALVYPSKYVKAADLKERDVTIIIANVKWEDLVMAGGKKDRKASIGMTAVNGTPLGKRWVIAKTVIGQIAEVTGEKKVERWIGKRVTMYPTTCKGARGQEVECIRVRGRVNVNASEVSEAMAAEPEPERDFIDEAGTGEELAS